ncbi:zinc ribbon domain-containing protein [Brachybacterium hainanense]|uniref:Zinc ribbon domain-containing protein n=1 Tax=Brachybacterium hainanense TaxID=1541174 RepID=A0ABV6R7T7_9MICO
MILYDLRCTAGHRFEAGLPSMFADNPDCPCGAGTSRVPAAVRQLGAASAGRSREEMPTTWRGISGGHPDVVRGWHREMTRREKLEEKHPELAGDRRPVLAHEGVFEGRPLRSGDALVPAVAKATFGTSETTRPAAGGAR